MVAAGGEEIMGLILVARRATVQVILADALFEGRVVLRRRDRQLDIGGRRPGDADAVAGRLLRPGQAGGEDADGRGLAVVPTGGDAVLRSEEHTSELQSLMRISEAVLCLKKKIKQNNTSAI